VVPPPHHFPCGIRKYFAPAETAVPRFNFQNSLCAWRSLMPAKEVEGDSVGPTPKYSKGRSGMRAPIGMLMPLRGNCTQRVPRLRQTPVRVGHSWQMEIVSQIACSDEMAVDQ